MSQSGQLLPAYLKPEAFAVALEIKEEQGSPYDGKAECIAKYPKDGTAEAKKPFQDQFYQLIEKFRDWGKKHALYTYRIENHLFRLEEQFFTSYSDVQEPNFFETIKKNLEKIILALQNDQIPLASRKTIYTNLCNNLGKCVTGIGIHIQDAIFNVDSLLSNISLNHWLAEWRTNTIKYYSEKCNTKHNIPDTYSAHVLKIFADEASNQGWNHLLPTFYIKDPHAGDDIIKKRVTEKDLVDFRQYFANEFNPKAIRECIQFNLKLAIDHILDGLGFNKRDVWHDSTLSYAVFTKRATNLINNLGIFPENGIIDFLDSNDDFTQFRLKENTVVSIVNILCERVLSPAIYFDPINEKYYKLVPYQWIDPRYPLELIDFTVWDNIPDEDFPSVLCRMLNEIDGKHVKQLLKNISCEKLQKIHKNEAFVKTLSSVINNKEKEAYIVAKISKILSVPEEKHQSFQPGENQPLDELLLHIVYGQKDKAEAIIKANPKLLFMSGNVHVRGDIFMDYSPLKLACYMHDMNMLKMMKPYAYQVQYGEEQFNSLLKETGEALKNRKTYDFAKLADVITSGDEAKINKALDDFRKHFKPKYINNKKSFNIKNVIQAYEIFINNYSAWNEEKRILYWHQVLFYCLLGSLPACYFPYFIIGVTTAKVFKEYLEECVKQKQEICKELIEPFPYFSALLYDAVNTCPENKKDSYFYLLACLVKHHWGRYYRADTIGVCNKAGRLTEESHEFILAGFNKLLMGIDIKFFSYDFLYGYAMLPDELKPGYLKLMLKQKNRFTVFFILPFEVEKIRIFSEMIHEKIDGKSFLHYILKECDVEIAKNFIRNAEVSELDQLDDIWTDINIYKLFSLEEEVYPRGFIQPVLKKIPPHFLEEIIKEPNNNPFNNMKLQEDFCNTLDMIGKKLKPQDLANLILNANIDHYYMLSNFDIFNKLSELLPAPLLLNIFVSKNLLAKAFDPEHSSSQAITSIVMLILQAIREEYDQEGILLPQKYITYNGIQTNFLGYFILRNNDQDVCHYQKIFAKINPILLHKCFNTMGIQDFTISLAMLEHIIKKFPYENLSDIFKVNFKISEDIPQEIFVREFFKLFPGLNVNNTHEIVKRISCEKLKAIEKSEFYASLKTPLIEGAISKRLALLEHKEEKDEKTVNQHQLFKPGKKELLDKLLMHVARGEQDQAEAIIDAHPDLLFQSGNVKDLAGNTFIDYSPCQLAAYAHDEHMLKMMAHYIHRVNDGAEQFTNILKEAEEASNHQPTYDFSQLVNAISHGNDAQIEEALEAFRKHFEPREIKNEKSFNLANLLQAYDIYIDNHNPWSVDQRTIFWSKVIGYLQRTLPACYAQAFCQGLYCVAMENKPLKRELTFGLQPFCPSAKSFYQNAITEQKGLGFDFAIHEVFGSPQCLSYSGCEGAQRQGTRAHLETLYKRKITVLRDLIKESHRPTKQMKRE